MNCSQDVVGGTIFESLASETSLDSVIGVGTGSGVFRSSGRSASIASSSCAASSSSTSFLPRSSIIHLPSSSSPPPLSKRSVSFVRDLRTIGSRSSRHTSAGGGGSGKAGTSTISTSSSSQTGPGVHTSSWTYKRQCMSVGDSIDERVEASTSTNNTVVGNEYFSIRSLASPTTTTMTSCTMNLEPCTGGSDIVAMVEAAVAAENNGLSSRVVLPRANGLQCLLPASFTEMNECCCLSDSSIGSCHGLTHCVD